MRPLLACFCLLATFGGCEPQPALAWSDEAIAQAIYRTENSKKYPYGIKSVHAGSVAEAHAICLRTIRRSRKQWYVAGNPGDFTVWLGRTYSPPSSNPNWVKLVKWFLKHPTSA